jgi:hypothetical protein
MNNTIFISIASYRDKELIKTINSCLSKAKYPENIKIGVCWQYDEEEDITLLDNISNIHIHKVYWKDVEGSVCWARSLIQQKFFNDEDYYFQIDSHTLFAQDWDETLINMYDKLLTDKAVISVGPPYYYNLNAEGALPHLDWEPVEFIDNIHRDTTIYKQKLDALDSNGFMMFGFKPAEDISKPILARHISAALLFTTGQWVRDVPYDPNLYFQGEEGSLALRSFTNGYDIYNPNKLVCWHLKYNFPDRKRHWNTFDLNTINKLSGKSFEQYTKLINGEDLGNYGLGSIRSMNDWELYSGMSYVNKIAKPEAYEGKTPTFTNVKVIAWAIDESKENAELLSKYMFDTSKKHNVDIELIGIGQKYQNLKHKLYVLQDYLKTQNPKTLIICLDAYDTLINNNLVEAVNKFKEKNTKILISAEKIFTYQWERFKDKFDSINSIYKYVNSGTYIGCVEDLKQMLDEVLELGNTHETNIDQGLVGIWVYNNLDKPEVVQLDTNCDLIWVTSGDIENLKYNQLNDNKLVNPITKTSPFIIHTPGMSDGYINESFKSACNNIIKW